MSAKTIRQQFAETMLAVGQTDPRLIVLVGDVSHFALQPFAKACPGRYYNVGICEPTIVSMAAGLAKVGFFPVVHTIAPFLIDRSFEQLKLDFGYQCLHGNLITVGGAFDYSNLGCTHHCYDDFALLRSIPNTQIVCPGSCHEFDSLFRQTYNNSYLTLFRIHEEQHGQEIDERRIMLGKAVKVTEGANLTIVAVGPQLKNAVDAREALIARGWEPEILYLATVQPLDIREIRASVAKTRHLLVIEEHNRVGGIGEEILAKVNDVGSVQFRGIAVDSFIHDYGSHKQHCARLGLSPEGVTAAAEKMLQ